MKNENGNLKIESWAAVGRPRFSAMAETIEKNILKIGD